MVVLDSMASAHARFGALMGVLEWLFTTLFTVKYGARMVAVRGPLRYTASAFGIIDLVALVPTYLAILVPGVNERGQVVAAPS